MSKKTGDFSGNKGEWSEVYVFLKLLADAKLQGADKNGNPAPNNCFKVLKVKYGEIEAFTGDDLLFKSKAGKCWYQRIAIQNNSEQLYRCICDGIGGRAFRIPDVEGFLREIGYTQLQVTGINKRDIEVQTDDPSRGQQPCFGYSIKSEIGGSPTLLNASKSTNLVFELEGLSTADIQVINSITGARKLIQRCEYIKERTSNIQFVQFANETFRRNLQGIDDGLPAIVAECVYAHYFENCKTTEDAVDYLKYVNPRNYISTDLYETKYKRFLRSVALGMKPATIWNDEDDATGGYIIAKPNGELVAFFIYDRKLFDEYLYTFTFFERADTKRHDFMQAYEMNKKVFINLNLQIRFKS